MTVIALASTSSAPGVSALSVGLSFAFDNRGATPLLVEADPSGGVIGLRFNLSGMRDLSTFTTDARRGYEPWLIYKNAADLSGIHTLLAPTDPLLATRSIERSAGLLAEVLPEFELPTLIDLGRLSDISPSLTLLQAADQVLLVSRPRIEEVQSLLFGIRLLKNHGCDVALVMVGNRPYNPLEVSEVAGVPLAATLPDDAGAAAAFVGGSFSARRLRRSMLMRSITGLADRLLVDGRWRDELAMQAEPLDGPYETAGSQA